MKNINQSTPKFIEQWRKTGESDEAIGRALLACFYVAIHETMEKYGKSMVESVIDQEETKELEEISKENLPLVTSAMQKYLQSETGTEIQDYFNERFLSALEELQKD